MSSYNRVILVGNITRDIELRYLQNGTAVTDVGLAVNEKVKKNNEWVEEVTFIDVTVWARTAEIMAEYCHKGSKVLIEGRLKMDQWEQNGQKRSKLKVVCDKMQMLDPKGGGGGGGQQQRTAQPQNNQYSEPASAPSQPQQYPGAQPDEDIPFVWLLPFAIGVLSYGIQNFV